MAKEVMTYTWCDICLEQDERTDAEEFTIQINALKPRLLALCDKHRTEVLDPVRNLLPDLPKAEPAPVSEPTRRRGVGRPVVFQPNAEEGRYQCTLCPGQRSYANARGLRSHGLSMHGMRAAEFAQALANPEAHQEALQAEPDSDLFAEGGEISEYKCEVCGQEFPHSQYSRPSQALGMHKARAHGIAGKSRAQHPSA